MNDRERLVHLNPALTSKYIRMSQWVPVLASTYRVRYGPTAMKSDTEPIRYVTIHFQDRRGAASFRYRNRAEITVFMGDQKPCMI